jgi:DNA-binding CsgD family transcriptional regulator
MGATLKVVAVNEGFALSTVAGSAAQCLRHIGLNGTARDAPMLLVMMAQASAGFATNSFFGAERFYSSVSVRVRRPDLALSSLLSPAEFEVLQLRIDGLSLREIATARSTALRTIANQLARVYQKLRVSGRAELLAALVKHARAREVFHETPATS